MVIPVTGPNACSTFPFVWRVACLTAANRNVTCVDKANVFKCFAFFRKIFDERAALYPDIAADTPTSMPPRCHVLRPWELDVLVIENMFGDILSDLAAGLIGGIGYAPSADIGDARGVSARPWNGAGHCGQGKANPIAIILSGTMMLEWLGEKHHRPQRPPRLLCCGARSMMPTQKELKPIEFGGEHGTDEITRQVLAAVGRG